MNLITKLSGGFIYFGLHVVMAYHFVMGNVFLNTAADDATGIEAAANFTLAPVQYLLCGQKAIWGKEGYSLEQRFNYDHNLPLKSAASVVSFPVALPTGMILKGVAFLSKETKLRHEKIVAAKKSTKIHSNLAYYRSIGLDVDARASFIDEPLCQRRAEDANNLTLEKELLKELVSILDKNQIPYWIDCGTCLGAYRYGGAIPWDHDIDLSILLDDFDNLVHALNALDPQKYQVQDWSNRCRPKTYTRIYIKENHNHVDVFCARIDPVQKTLTYIPSNEISSFMPESWKERERRYANPTDFNVIFPLKKAHFDGLEVSVPGNIVQYLQERYGENLAPIRIYNETTKQYEKDLTHPFWQLSHGSGD